MTFLKSSKFDGAKVINWCRSSRVKTRQSTLWGMWSSSSGGLSMDNGAEVERVATSWGGPSKDRKGDG